MRNFGLNPTGEGQYIGGNAKMSEFQAAMGICNLRHLKSDVESRSMADMRYRENLCGTEGIKLCRKQKGTESNYAYFPVIFDGFKYNRDEVFDMLKAEGIMARKYFYPLTSDLECHRKMNYSGGENTPVARYLSEKVLTLPLYSGLEKDDIDRICSIIKGD